MKKTLTILLLILILSSCSSDDKTKVISEIDKLPPATEIGKNTFGCLLDGKAFTPDKSNNSLQCSYEIIDGEYYFYIRASRETSATTNASVYIISEKKQISQGATYDLVELADGNLYGAVSTSIYSNGITTMTTGKTSQTNSGKLTITHLSNQVVSGTFFFNVKTSDEITHFVTDGRFDVEYTN